MSRICIVSPSLKLGGIERALTTLANEFQVLGHEVHFLICLKDKHFYKIPESIYLYEPTFQRTNSKVNKLLFYPRLLKFIRSTVRYINPDRVLVFGDWFSPMTLLALYSTPYQVFISDRTIPDYKFKFPIPLLKQWLYPSSAGFIAQTKRAEDFKIKLFGKKLNIRVIPNALPEFKIQTDTDKEEKLIYVGRFEWEKDPELLIRAFGNIARDNPNWTLEMAGTGPLLEPIKKLVQELGLETQVLFLGKVSEIAELYQSASLLVLPSIVEGFPNTLIEAMSFGLPIVCFDDIPVEDILTHGVDGIVLTKRTPELLAAEVTALIKNDALRKEIGYNAKMSVSRYQKSKIAREFLEFFRMDLD